MKHVKTRIVIIVVTAIMSIAALFLIAFNVFINNYFINEAKKTIQNDIDSNAGNYDDSFNNIFSSYMKFYFLSQEGDEELRNYSDGIEGNNIYDFIKKNNIPDATVSQMSVDGHLYVFALNSYSYYVDYSDGEMSAANDGGWYEQVLEEEKYIVFVDIFPVMSFMKRLNWIFVVILIAVTAVMSFVGLKFGRKIENTQNNQNKFFQNASHELKTPLMSIQGYAEAIQTDIMDHKKAAGVIMEESDRMTDLVEEILTISKIDTGQIKLNTSRTDVKEVLYDCIESQEIVFNEHNMAINIDFCTEKTFINADDVQLRRAFLNIISNDLRFCRKELNISCAIKNENVLIRFADDGPGLDTDMQNNIFTRFYTGKNGKTGIGLALTKEIILMHKGKIEAYNGKNCGTVFEIQLPLMKA